MTQQNAIPELKPCPFCSKELDYGRTKYAYHRFDEESICPLNGFGIQEGGVLGWNTRTPDNTYLLKQAREALSRTEMRLANNFIPTPSELDDAITAIDKVLGENHDK